MNKRVAIPIISILTLTAIVLGVLFFNNNAKKDKQIAVLNSNIIEKNKKIELLNTSISDQSEQIDTLSADISTKASQLEILNVDIADKASEIEKLNAEVIAKANQIETLDAEVADKASEIEKLNAEVIAKAEQIETLDAEVADKASEIEKLKADVTAKAEQIETLDAEVADKASEIEKLKADVADKASQIEKLKDDIYSKFANVDLRTASYEDMSYAYERIKAVMIERLKEKYISNHVIEEVDGITFRGIPWGTAKKDTEAILGIGNSGQQILDLGDGTGTNTKIGVHRRYRDMMVSGYQVDYTDVYYFYPTIDGQLLSYDDDAVFYMGEYNLSEVGDVKAVTDDLSQKLNKLYGSYTEKDGDRIWTDKDMNTIKMKSYSSRISISYIYSKVKELYAAANQAFQNEKAEQEEINRIKNQDNTDGL